MSKKITLPCLSVQQPYADLICAGVKDVENRTWKTDVRGTILIHASSSIAPKKAFNMAISHPGFTILHDPKFLNSDQSDFDYDAIAKDENAKRQLAIYLKWMEKNSKDQAPPFRTGAIIGTVDIVDVIPIEKSTNSIWEISGNYKWVLENPSFLKKPVLYQKGKLKIYRETVDASLKTTDVLEWLFSK